jgi:hypothetical protein
MNSRLIMKRARHNTIELEDLRVKNGIRDNYDDSDSTSQQQGRKVGECPKSNPQTLPTSP